MSVVLRESSISPEYVILKLGEKLDTVIAETFEVMLNDVIHNDKRHVIIDFRDSNYLSSMGLRVLFSASRALKEKKRRLILINVGPTVMKVINIADCAELFEIFDTEDKAVLGEKARPAGG